MGRPTGAIASGVMNASRLSDAPSPEGAHAYFDAWAASPNIVHAYSLRDDAQLTSLANVPPASPGWVYDATLDAAKGTVLFDNPIDADVKPQLHIMDATDTGTVTFVWDGRIPAAWSPYMNVFPGKSYQTSKDLGGSALGIFMETRYRPGKVDVLPIISCIDWRCYGTLGPGASIGSVGDPGCRNGDCVQPLLVVHFMVYADTWTRFIEHVELQALVDSGTTYDLWSLWVGDETQAVMQLYDQIPVAHPTGGVKGFAFEFDNSQPMPVGAPHLSVYCRDFLMFRGLTDVTALLVQPVS